MLKNPTRSNSNRNRLLEALPAKTKKQLLSKSESFELKFGDVIYEPDDVIGDVYFPVSGIISILSTIDKRSLLEVGMVGNEGMAGLPIFLGVERAGNRAIVQGKGAAVKIKPRDFLDECERNGHLSRLLRRYTHSFLTQISQSAACNRFHKLDARLARWLLMTHDRMGADEFRLTQDFLSHMLGVRREAVTLAAQGLQKDNLISYRRGKLKIVNRSGLEAVSCQCYSITFNEERNVFS